MFDVKLRKTGTRVPVVLSKAETHRLFGKLDAASDRYGLAARRRCAMPGQAPAAVWGGVAALGAGADADQGRGCGARDADRAAREG